MDGLFAGGSLRVEGFDGLWLKRCGNRTLCGQEVAERWSGGYSDTVAAKTARPNRNHYRNPEPPTATATASPIPLSLTLRVQPTNRLKRFRRTRKGMVP